MRAVTRLRRLDGVPPWVLPGASADLDFVNNRYWALGSTSLAALVACSRGASEYVTTSAGLLVPVGLNTPARSDAGAQIWQSATNLFLHSQDTQNLAVVGGANAATSVLGPDGLASATKFTEDSSNGFHIGANVSYATVGAQQTLSVYAKANGRSWIQLQLGNGTNGNAYFNISNGTIGNVSGTAVASITPVANGFYRCTLTSPSVSTNTNSQVLVASANGTSSYQGDGASGIYFWVPQLETNSFATPPIPTTTSTVTRAADNLTAIGSLLTAILNAKAARFVSNSVNFNAAAVNRIFAWDNATVSSIFFSTASQLQIQSNGQSAIATIGASGTASGLVKSAFGFDGSSMTVVANGGTKATSAHPWSNGTTAYIGNRSALDRALNGNILRMSFGPTKGMFDSMTTNAGQL